MLDTNVNTVPNPSPAARERCRNARGKRPRHTAPLAPDLRARLAALIDAEGITALQRRLGIAREQLRAARDAVPLTTSLRGYLTCAVGACPNCAPSATR